MSVKRGTPQSWIKRQSSIKNGSELRPKLRMSGRGRSAGLVTKEFRRGYSVVTTKRWQNCNMRYDSSSSDESLCTVAVQYRVAADSCWREEELEAKIAKTSWRKCGL